MGEKTMAAAHVKSIAPQNVSSPLQVARRAAVIIAATALSLSISGCKRYLDEPPVMGYAVNDHEARHPIEVVKNTKGIRLSVPRNAYGLTAHQQRKVRNFLAAYSSDPQGSLMIAAPSGAANEGAAFNMLSHIRRLTREYEIPAAAIHFRPYYAEGSSRPAIRMSFQKDIAIAPQCGDWSENLARNRSNLPYPNFGCSMQHNLAVMIANPRDLVEPRGGNTPRSGDRRSKVWEKYVKGETTGAKKSKQQKTSVSDVAK